MPRVAVLALAAFLAGCLAPATAPSVEVAATEAAAPLPALDLAGTGCTEGGGHSVHPSRVFKVLPDPWVPADVLADVGPQLAYSEMPDPASPVPSEGRTMGNYHATFVCDAWTFRGEPRDMFLGFVGMKVERPPFDTGGAAPTHHYLVTVVATDDPDVHAALTAGGIRAMNATYAWEEPAPDLLRIRMWTDANGAYDSVFRPKAFGAMQATHVRLWFQQSLHGHGHEGEHDGASVAGEFRPVALDLLAAPGGEHFVADAQGYFSHSGTDHHAPLPGAHGHTAAVLYRGFDRAVEWGPRPDVVVDAAYVH